MNKQPRPAAAPISATDMIGISRLNALLIVVVLLAVASVALMANDRLLLHVPFALPYYCQSHFVDFPDKAGGGVIERIPKADRVQRCIDSKGIVPARADLDPNALP